ncbi:hypothetical protein [Methylobacterium oryzae]|uniref:hypothetical protein n=1 Tax=Methylobacterium oryzae TaxID=334852 RepID=UPI002F3526C2
MPVFDGPLYTIYTGRPGRTRAHEWTSWRTMAPIPAHRLQNVKDEYGAKWDCQPEQIKIEVSP